STSPPAPAAQAKKRPATPSQSGPTVPVPTQPPRVEFRPSGQSPATSPPRPVTPPPVDPFAPPPDVGPAEIELAYPDPRPWKQAPIAIGSGPHATAQPRPSGEAAALRTSGQVPATPRVSGPVAVAAASPSAAEPAAAPAPAVRPRPSLGDPRVR